jgi:Uma2 family endonuclease
MRIYAAEAPPGLLEERRRHGHDRYDEMWEGVLHMNAVPHGDHQDLAIQLGAWLIQRWARPGVCKVYPDRNVAPAGGWPRNYRIPDLVLMTVERRAFDKGTHIEGPPLVCVEIHSPNDEAYDKLDFYADLGIPEVWIIDRDTKAVDLFVLNTTTGAYDASEAADEGWLLSRAANIELMGTPDFKLAIRIAGTPQIQAELPVDDEF